MGHIYFWLILHIVEAIPIYMIASKSAHEYAWVAWIPIAQWWLLLNMADLDTWFFIGWLIPGVNFVLFGFVWWRIAENTNKPGWTGLLMYAPIVNWFVGYYLAFVDTGQFIA